MPKSSVLFSSGGYRPVAERIHSFYRQFPAGRIITELVSRTEQQVVFRAMVYRSVLEREPAATGWAAEREGDGEINTVACLENAETSAIGRALANLGFSTAPDILETQEPARAAPTRYRDAVPNEPATAPQRRERVTSSRDALHADLRELIARAEALGVRRARARNWMASLDAGRASLAQLLRCERRLRIWVARQARVSPL